MDSVPAGVMARLQAPSARAIDARIVLYDKHEHRFVPRDELIARSVEHKAREWLDELEAMRVVL